MQNPFSARSVTKTAGEQLKSYTSSQTIPANRRRANARLRKNLFFLCTCRC
jgi:hypothetical protein